MHTNIEFATSQAEDELQELFTAYGMSMAGDVDEHIVVKQDNKIVAGAMVAQLDNSLYHILLFAVRMDVRSQGVGSRLMQAMLRNPGRYCQPPGESSDPSYQVTTVARGTAVPFYEQNGFIACNFSELAYPFDTQCTGCSDKNRCKPVAMMFARS